MGTPTESTWPGVSSYTNYNEYKGFPSYLLFIYKFTKFRLYFKLIIIRYIFLIRYCHMNNIVLDNFKRYPCLPLTHVIPKISFQPYAENLAYAFLQVKIIIC